MATARAYELTGRIPEDQKFKGQAQLIVDFMRKSEAPLTVAQTVAAIEKELVTRQDPTRVVSFYMSVWKKKGWVKESSVEVTEAEASAAAAADSTDEPMNHSEENLGVTANESIAAQVEADVEASAEETEEPVGAATGREARREGRRRRR